MTYRKVNLFSDIEGNFGIRSGNDTGGWAIAVEDPVVPAFLYRLDKFGLTYKYIPDKAYGSEYIGNLLAVITTDIVDTITINSPWVPIQGGDIYLASIFVLSPLLDADITIDFELSETTVIGETYATNNTLSEPATAGVDASYGGRMWGRFITLPNHNYARMVATVSGRGVATLPDKSYVWLYDPVISEDLLERRGEMTAGTYASLPSFMRLDDERIADITGTTQFPYPLHRYTETLCYTLDKIYDIARTFTYTHPAEGDEYKSALTDPVTANADYLEWLATLNGTNLFSLTSGSTPWVALQGYDGPDAGDLEGQWDDFESLETWQGIQNLNPEFFDPVAGFRNQIRTGFTGINAGRTDTVEEYIRTLIDASDNDDTVVTVVNKHMDNPYRVKLLVDPNADPDNEGQFLTEITNKGLAAGATASKTGNIVEAGHGRLDIATAFYPAVTSNSSGYGMTTYSRSSVTDSAHNGRHLLVNQNLNSKIPEKGGIVAPAHYTEGSQYYYGKLSSVSSGYIETASSSFCDIGGKSTGYDIIVVVSDITFPTATADTGTYVAATPQGWYFREKRLLVSGSASAGSTNDWAVYLVAGLSKSADTETRLLLIDGFQTQNGTNYALSNPLNMENISNDGQSVFRVSRSATVGGSATVTFYAQKTLYDEWSNSSIGAASLIPTSTSAGAGAKIKVLGDIVKAGSATSVTWANASALPCAVSRVMVYNAPVSFSGAIATSSAVHAYVNGVGTSAFSAFSYTPTIDIDLTNVSTYGTSFNSVINGSTYLATTVNQAASAAIDYGLLVAKTGPSSAWYFGSSGDVTKGVNRLTVAGASIQASTTYNITASAINTSTGVVTSSSHTLVSSAASVLTFQDNRAYGAGVSYGGTTFAGVDVYKPSPSVKVAGFTPTTIASAASSGVDTLGASWAISRLFPAASVTYSPAQVVDRSFLHVYNGSLKFNNAPNIETYRPFSVLLQLRRFWNTGTSDIFSVYNTNNDGLFIYYDGTAIKASFKDSSATELVSWSEGASVGNWNWIIVRRDPTSQLSIVGNGNLTTSGTQDVLVTKVFSDKTSVAHLGTGALGEYNARFGLAEFVFFDRYLSDEEITLLSTQIL